MLLDQPCSLLQVPSADLTCQGHAKTCLDGLRLGISLSLVKLTQVKDRKAQEILISDLFLRFFKY